VENKNKIDINRLTNFEEDLDETEELITCNGLLEVAVKENNEELINVTLKTGEYLIRRLDQNDK
jgi:hypothetical protein